MYGETERWPTGKRGEDRTTFARFGPVWRCEACCRWSEQYRTQIHNGNVLADLLYVSECWLMKQQDARECRRSTPQVHEEDCKYCGPTPSPTPKLLRVPDEKDMDAIPRKGRWRWLGHAERTDAFLPKWFLTVSRSKEGQKEGKEDDRELHCEGQPRKVTGLTQGIAREFVS